MPCKLFGIACCHIGSVQKCLLFPTVWLKTKKAVGLRFRSILHTCLTCYTIAYQSHQSENYLKIKTEAFFHQVHVQACIFVFVCFCWVLLHNFFLSCQTPGIIWGQWTFCHTPAHAHNRISRLGNYRSNVTQIWMWVTLALSSPIMASCRPINNWLT